MFRSAGYLALEYATLFYIIFEYMCMDAIQLPKSWNVDQIIEKIVEVPKVQVYTQDNVVIQERIKEVETIREKIVPVKETVIQRIPVQQIIEKIV